MSDDVQGPTEIHPASEQIAAYLSNALGTDERAAMESHLSRCRACRRQVTSAQALIRTRPRRTPWIIGVAAAVIAVAFLQPWGRTTNRGDGQAGDVERSRADTFTARGIVSLTPADGDTVVATDARFAWRGRGPDVLYRLSVTDGRGQALWTTETSDTVVALPSTVILEPGRRYFWFVDALGSNAGSWTTGTRAFVAAP